MNLNSTSVILTKLDDMVFSEDIKPIYNLIREFPNRIQFVKDHNGVKNVLFISTEDATKKSIFEYPAFAAFHYKGDTEEEYKKSIVEYTSEEIYKETKEFLETTIEPLYVGIGFTESYVTNEDYFEVLYLMEDTKCNVVDAIVSLRRFPEWYGEEAEYPFYILKEKEYLERMSLSEKEYLLNLKQTYLLEMNETVELNDEKRFNEICEDIKIITKQLTEYK
jgi:hypothetical protein